VKTKTKPSAAEIASNEMIAALTEDQVLFALRTAMHRARVWYRLKGKRFRLPKATNTKRN
jgi:hypothetical protein